MLGTRYFSLVDRKKKKKSLRRADYIDREPSINVTRSSVYTHTQDAMRYDTGRSKGQYLSLALNLTVKAQQRLIGLNIERGKEKKKKEEVEKLLSSIYMWTLGRELIRRPMMTFLPVWRSPVG